MDATADQAQARPMSERGGVLEVLGVATRLGLTSFGGPIAHLGYFHAEYVTRRRWLTEQAYADLVAFRRFGAWRARWPLTVSGPAGRSLPPSPCWRIRRR